MLNYKGILRIACDEETCVKLTGASVLPGCWNCDSAQTELVDLDDKVLEVIWARKTVVKKEVASKEEVLPKKATEESKSSSSDAQKKDSFDNTYMNKYVDNFKDNK